MKKLLNYVRLRDFFGYLYKHWFIAFAAVVYIFFTASYMGPGFTDCTNSIYGFGDSTAGPIWRNSLKPEQPLLGGYENSTNFPKGESLYSPVSYVSLVQTVSMKAASKVVGPVCAYNLYNIVGYISTSMVMFLFVFYLVRSRWIGLLAGYAVAFTPYVQSKVGGHPSYGYASLLIAALWLLMQLITTARNIYAVLLAVVLAACAYFDPYFILLVMTVAVPVFIVMGYDRYRNIKQQSKNKQHKQLKKYLKNGMLFMLAFTILLSPLVFIRIKDAATIDSSVGNVRGNVVDAAMLCSNKPIDYLLPDPANVHLVALFGQGYTAKNIAHRNWCGYGESRVSISLTLLLVCVIGVGILIKKKYMKQDIKAYTLTKYGTNAVIIAVLLIALIAFLLGLPPYIDGAIMPSGIILKITSMWRIFAREYLVLNLAVVLMSVLMLKYLSTVKVLATRRWARAVLFSLVFLGVILEYQINAPFQPMTFNFKRDIPTVYKYIKQDKKINAIAEYPIDRMGLEYDSVVYYATMQVVHEKKILNSVALKDPDELEHIALKDLSDPQTIPALRYLGINYVVVHGEKIGAIKAKLGEKAEILKHDNPKVFSLKVVRDDKSNDVVLVALNENRSLSNILEIKQGYVENLPLIYSPLNVEYEVLNGSVFTVAKLGKDTFDGDVCFDAKMSATGDKSMANITIDNQTVATTMLTGRYQTFRLKAKSGDSFTLKNDRGYNMRINNLDVGCYGSN